MVKSFATLQNWCHISDWCKLTSVFPRLRLKVPVGVTDMFCWCCQVLIISMLYVSSPKDRVVGCKLFPFHTWPVYWLQKNAGWLIDPNWDDPMIRWWLRILKWMVASRSIPSMKPPRPAECADRNFGHDVRCFHGNFSGSPTRHVFVGRMGFFCVERVLHEGDFKGFSFLWFLSLVFQIHWKLLGVQNKYQTSRISMVFGSLVCFFFFADEEKQKRDWLVQCLAARPEQTWSCQALVSTRPFCKTWIGPTGSSCDWYSSPISLPTSTTKII